MVKQLHKQNTGICGTVSQNRAYQVSSHITRRASRKEEWHLERLWSVSFVVDGQETDIAIISAVHSAEAGEVSNRLG